MFSSQARKKNDAELFCNKQIYAFIAHVWSNTYWKLWQQALNTASMECLVEEEIKLPFVVPQFDN